MFRPKSAQHSGNTENVNQLNNNKEYQLSVSNLILKEYETVAQNS